jgi:hypothetical protein
MDKSFQYLQTPSKSKIEPPIDGTINELPIEKLDWEDFEKLCLRMVEIEHSIDNCEIYGIKGQKQHGIDIFAKIDNGKYSNYQCKRYQVINESNIEDAVTDFQKGDWFSISDKFTFCTTASLNETKLQNKFNTLKADLKETGITLVKWDKIQICRILKEYPLIVNDFFGKEWVSKFNGPLIIGSIEDSINIKNRDGSTNKLISVSEFLNYNPDAFLDFNDYLKQNKLKYFSRGQFLNDTKQINPDFVTEKKILDDLISENYVACIISGEGGIGKTRLMYEVAKRAEKKYKFQTYRIEQNIQSVEDVFAQLKPNNNYLFVFDYIEENELFDQFIERAAKKHFHVKILGNCRNTHYWNDRYFIAKHHLDNGNEFERDYQRRVTQEIMQPIWVNFLKEGNKKFYKTKPSFAVFLRFLFDKNLTENDITNFPDFETWLIRRFSLSLKDENQEEQYIKTILLLPIIEYASNENIEVSIRSFKRKHAYITKLVEDGWLQVTENSIGTKRLDTVHDTIKDELFLYILNKLKNKTSLIDKLIETIEFAQSEKLENNWFRSLERISDSNTLKAYGNFFIDFFNETLREKNLLTESSIFHISKTNLLSEPQRFECIVNNPNPFYKFTSNQSFGLSLQNAMNYFCKALKNENRQTPVVLKTLADEWLKKNEKFIDVGYLADRFISTYLNLYSINDFIQPYFFQFLSNKFTEFGGFSLCSWLEQGGDKTAIENYLIDFLKHNAKEKETSFVIQAWLEQGGDKTAVKSYLIEFLKQNAKEKETSFVIQEWLEQGGDTTTVESYLIEFLKHNAKEKETSFVIQAWLEQGGDTTTVESYLIEFLKQNAKEKKTSFVIQAWLEQGGDTTTIESYLIEFLKQNAKEKDVKHVLSAWLNKGSDNTTIESYLIEFLKHNAKEKEARYVLSAWLNKGGDTTTVESYLIEFLKHNANEKEARYVLSAWLNKDGDKATIESYLFVFLKQNAKEKETSFVIQAWLEHGGDKTAVEIYLIEFLKKNAKEKETSFVFQAWLEQGGDKTAVKSYLIEFLKKNAKEKETSFVIQAWLEQGGDTTTVESYLIEFLKQNAKEKETSFVIQAWLEQGGDTTTVESYLIEFLKQNAKDIVAEYVLSAWLNNDGDITPIESYLFEFLKQNAKDIASRFVIDAWLKNGGDKTSVEVYLIEFLKQNSFKKESSFVIRPWLKCGGSAEIITEYIYDYLSVHADKVYSPFVLHSYLKLSSFDSERIKPYLKKWFEKYLFEKSSKYLLIDWLTKTKDNNFIKPYMIKWLELFPEDDFASVIIEQWIKNGGDYNTITK